MNTKRITVSIKRICSVLLLISFFLPIARGCSKIEIPYQEDKVNHENTKPFFSMDVKEPKKKYAYDFITLEETSTSSALLFLFFCYLWPIPILTFQHFIRKKTVKYLVECVELFFCIGTIYLIMIFAAFEGELLSGGYLAITSVSVYFGSAGFELCKEIHIYFKDRKS